MSSRDAIAIGISRHRLMAVLGSPDAGTLTVKRLLVTELPEDLPRDDAQTLGKWVGDQLRDGGFPRGKVTVALSREQFGLKRITLPTTDATELPEMTRLAMQRELPFDASEAVIDYLPVHEGDSSTTVIAVAVPERVMASTEQMLEAAGRGPQRVALRVLGAAALASSLGGDASDSTLVIDVSGDSVEFCVVVDGAVRFSRAAELSPGLSDSQLTDAVTTETRRTWMSYRIVESADDVHRVVVIGVTKMVEAAARSVGEMLKVPCQVLDYHPLVQDDGQALGRTWPLAGLLLESARGTPSIDFAHPRQTPDPTARRRRLAMAIVGGAIIVLASAYMLSTVKIKRLEGAVGQLAGQYQQMIPDRIRYKRDRYRVEHLEQWQTVHVDWLSHLAELATIAPGPEQVVLDDFSGALDFRGVRYEGRGRTASWSTPRDIKITIEGEARDRTTADAFRAALVANDLYQANTPSPDTDGGRRLPYSFTYTLRTDQIRPGAADESAEGVGESGEQGERQDVASDGTSPGAIVQEGSP